MLAGVPISGVSCHLPLRCIDCTGTQMQTAAYSYLVRSLAVTPFEISKRSLAAEN